MFKLYQRYLVAHFLPPFMMSLIFFVGFLLTSQLFKLMRIVTKKDVEILVIFELFGHIGISFLPMAVPLSLLFATIYTLNRLSEDSEVVAMRAFGINKYQLFKPFLVIAIFSAVTIFSLNRNLIPYSKRLFKNTVITLTSKGFLADIKKEKFYTDIPGVTLFTENVGEDGTVLQNVFIKLKKGESKDQVIMAKKGVLIKSAGEAKTYLDLKLDLYDGNIISVNKGGEELEKIVFDKYEFPIVSGGSNKFVNRDSMRSNTELSAIIDFYRKKLGEDTLSKNDRNKVNSSLSKSLLEYWTRFNVPIQCLAFVLLGFVFGVKKGRGNSKNTAAKALLITILYYVIFFAGVSVAKKGNLPPWIAIFTPTLIISIIAGNYYKKFDWAS